MIENEDLLRLMLNDISKQWDIYNPPSWNKTVEANNSPLNETF